MRLKTSKPHRALTPWRDEPSCSEATLRLVARDLAAELVRGQHILLEGPMGAGKSTFARALISALDVSQLPEGSPSFAIAHEYDTSRGHLVHIDFYRINSEAEIEEAGLPTYFWERDDLVITEWLANWPAFEKKVLETRSCWLVHLEFGSSSERQDLRYLKISKNF